jgi:hypothetical protein
MFYRCLLRTFDLWCSLTVQFLCCLCLFVWMMYLLMQVGYWRHTLLLCWIPYVLLCTVVFVL